jgi:hypothetical protein
MTHHAAPQARQLSEVPVEPLVGPGHDYADAFEIRSDEPDPRTAEQFARAALEQAPRAVRWTVLTAWRGLLRFRLGPTSSPNHVLGMQIMAARPEAIHLQAESWLIRGAVVGRKVDPRHVVVSTYVFYTSPVAARIVWTAVGPLHRRVARYLMEHAAALGEREEEPRHEDQRRKAAELRS